jgi:hypothetical protein
MLAQVLLIEVLIATPSIATLSCNTLPPTLSITMKRERDGDEESSAGSKLSKDADTRLWVLRNCGCVSSTKVGLAILWNNRPGAPHWPNWYKCEDCPKFFIKACCRETLCERCENCYLCPRCVIIHTMPANSLTERTAQPLFVHQPVRVCKDCSEQMASNPDIGRAMDMD